MKQNRELVSASVYGQNPESQDGRLGHDDCHQGKAGPARGAGPGRQHAPNAPET